MKVENLNVKRIKFRDDITALRALAVISVLLYHAEFQLFKGGWLGVDIFLLYRVTLYPILFFLNLQIIHFHLRSFIEEEQKEYYQLLLQL